jgi:fucose permease
LKEGNPCTHHFCYSAGAIATGYLILPFKGVSWPWAYGVVGISLAAILILGLYQEWAKRTKDAETSSGDSVKIPEVQAGPVLPLVKDAAFVLYTLVILFYMGNQVVCSAWIPVYVEMELGQSPAIVGTSLTVFWVGIALARLLIGPIMQRGGKPFLLSIGGMLFAGISLVALTSTDSIMLVLLYTALCGFFAGATIPMYIVVTTTWFPKNTAFISLSYLFGGAIGRMIFPWLVTKIASFTSLSFSLMLSSSMLFISAILIFIVRKITKQRPVFV